MDEEPDVEKTDKSKWRNIENVVFLKTVCLLG